MTNEDIKMALDKVSAAVQNAQFCAARSEWQAVANYSLAARQYLQAISIESADRVYRARMKKGK